MRFSAFYVLFIAVNLNVCAQTAVLTCNAGWPYNPNFSIDSILQDEGTCNNLDAKINVAVLDSCSFIPWTTDTCIYGYNGSSIYQCGSSTSNCVGHPQPFSYFQFEVYDTAQSIALSNFLSSIPSGNHILVFTFNRPPYSVIPNWPSVQSALVTLGSNMILTIPDSFSFIFYVKKGYLSSMQEIAVTQVFDTVSLAVTIECMPASVNENAEGLLLSLFPNPARDEFTISNFQFSIKEVEIYDAMGEKWLLTKVGGQNEKTTFDISSLSAGIYFVRIMDEKNNMMVKKFIKM